MSDKKKAFWFIALLSTLVIIPFLGETIFYSKGGTARSNCSILDVGKRQLDIAFELRNRHRL